MGRDATAVRHGGLNEDGTGRGPELKRTLGLGLLVLYGLGVTVGAGIYVLVGAAGSRAGVHAPLAFLVAASVMALSAASFAELAVRYPVSAGEAAYIDAGFGSKHLTLVSGVLVVVAGVVSAAAISHGAAGYLGYLVPAPATVLVGAVVLGMGLVAAWGIKEAVAVAAVLTLIEIGGLLVIVMTGLWQKPAILSDLPMAFSNLDAPDVWRGVLGASLIAFFAFIGFEGMVNVAEEVKRPERTLPLAIGITLAVSTILYIAVVWVVIRSVPPGELATTSAPLSLAYERLTGASPVVISLIAVFATINGVIVQMVMASRVVYGLARRGALPSALGKVNEKTRTPLSATGLVVTAVLVLALAFPIDRLADATTRVMLVVFALVNLALLAIKWRGDRPSSSLGVPIFVPALGAMSCLGLLFADLLR
jgi:basic amino acid/polyamine antiporter, APA family